MPLSGNIILRTSEEITEMEASRRGLELINALSAEDDLNWTLTQAGNVHVHDIRAYLHAEDEYEIALNGLTIGRAELAGRILEKANGE